MKRRSKAWVHANSFSETEYNVRVKKEYHGSLQLQDLGMHDGEILD